MIVGLLQVVFYVSAVAALLAGGVGFTRLGLPGIAAWPLAWLVSAYFGLAMTSLLLSFPRMERLYEEEPVNGATGRVFTISELLIPYLIGCGLVGFILPPALAQRQHNGLPPFTIPGWLLYAPFAIALPMGMARLFFRTPPAAEPRQQMPEQAPKSGSKRQKTAEVSLPRGSRPARPRARRRQKAAGNGRERPFEQE